MEMKKSFLINLAFYAVMLAFVVLVYKYILPILTPFIIGFCVAALVRLPLRKLHLKNPRHARWASALLCILVYVLIGGLIILVGVRLVSEVGAFISALPGIVESLIPHLTELGDEIEALLSPFGPSVARWVIELGDSIVQHLGQFATDLSAAAVKLVANGAVSLPGLIISIILTIVSTFYIAADYDMVIGFFKKLIPAQKREVVLGALGYGKTAVLAFIKSYSIMFGVTFLELCIGLSLLKIPYAIPIALAIAVFDLMPVLGVGGILLPWSAILVCMGNFPLAIGVLLLYITIAIVRNTLEPRIVGSHIGLHPLATLVAMILGLKLIGLFGMLLFPISLVAATQFLKRKKAAEEPASATE